MSHSQNQPPVTLRQPLRSDGSYQGVTRKPVRQHDSKSATSWTSKTEEAVGAHDKGTRIRRRTFISVWGLELSCCILTVCALGAIVATLLPCDRQPLPSLPYHISVNSVVAVFATIIKACNILALAEGLSQLKWEHFKSPKVLKHLTDYDAASRGPWGCLQLLGTFHKHSITAIIGAVLSVLVLAIDPFAQQLVSYYPCPVEVINGTVARIPRSSVWNQTGRMYGPSLWESTTNMKNAMYNGLFTPDLVQIPVECMTGNCTFDDDYATLSFCSECVDVTDELEVFWTSFTVRDGPYRNTTTNEMYYDNERVIDCLNTSLPSGSYASSATVHGSIFTMTASGEIGNHYATTVELILGGSPLGVAGNDSIEFVPAASLYASPGCVDAWQNDKWGCKSYGAARCTIKPCVKVLSADVRFGKIQETEVGVFTDWLYSYPWLPDENRVDGYPSIVMTDTSCVQRKFPGILNELGFNSSSPRFVPYRVQMNSGQPQLFQSAPINGDSSGINMTLSEEQLFLFPKSCIYQIYSVGSLDPLVGDLREFLRGSVDISGNVNGLLGDPIPFNFFNDSYLNIESIRQAFAGISQAMSIQVRKWDADQSSTFNQPAVGKVYANDTCIKVRWPWIVYPAAISLATICFLVNVLIQTERKDRSSLARGWKSSLLPLIYHGMNGMSNGAKGAEFQIFEVEFMGKAAKKDIGYITSSDTQGEPLQIRISEPQPNFQIAQA